MVEGDTLTRHMNRGVPHISQGQPGSTLQKKDAFARQCIWFRVPILAQLFSHRVVRNLLMILCIG